MGAVRQPRGVAGGKRGKVKPSQHVRQHTPRAAAALDAVRRQQEALDMQAAAEAEQARKEAADRRVEAARQQSEERFRQQVALEARRTERRSRWTLGQARSLIRQGYTVEHAMTVTGYDRADFDSAPGPDIYEKD